MIEELGEDDALGGSDTAALAVQRDRSMRFPSPGEYWYFQRGFKENQRYSLRRRSMVLVEKLRRINGVVHSVVVHAHPLDPDQSSIALTLATFLEKAAFMPNGAEIRDRELKTVEQRMAGEQRAIGAGPPPERVAAEAGMTVGELRALGALPVLSSNIAEAATHTQRADLARVVARHVKVAEATRAWLQERNDEVSSLSKSMMRFHRERVSAALASVAQYEELAEKIGESVKTLGLYLGTDVEVTTLATGASAAPDTKLALYQRRIYMDEEYATHLALGGARWRDLDDFSAALATDDALRARVLPLERCVVLMQIRRHSKPFHLPEGIDGLAGFRLLMQDIADRQADQRCFLLVRDGENIHRVDADFADDAEYLFPTNEEREQPFRADDHGRRFHGIDGSTLTPESVEYYEASNEFDAVMLFYRRLMVLMWGLHDRLGLFGPFYDPSRYANFMDLRLHTDRMLYISDEDQVALGDGRPTWRAWLADRNAIVQPGSRVVLNWDGVFNRERTPGLGLAEIEPPAYVLTGKEQTRFGVTTVEFVKGRPTVKVPAKRYWGERQHFNVRARLRLGGIGNQRYDGERVEWLCLDAVTADDLNYYIGNRAARCDYAAFLALFIAARTILQAEAREEAALRKKIATSLGVSVNDPQIGGTLAAWRQSNRDLAPLRVWKERGAPFIAELADLARSRALKISTAVAKAEAIAAAERRQPLRLSQDRRGRLYLYASTLPEERPFGAHVDHPWIVKTPLTDTPRFAPTIITIGERVDEVPVHDWLGVADVVQTYDLRYFERLRHVHQRLVTCFSNAREGLTTAFDPANLESLIEIFKTARALPGMGVNDNAVVVPLGMARGSRYGDDPREGVLLLSQPMLGICCMHGKPTTAGALAATYPPDHLYRKGDNPLRYVGELPKLEWVDTIGFDVYLHDGRTSVGWLDENRGLGIGHSFHFGAFGNFRAFAGERIEHHAGLRLGPLIVEYLDSMMGEDRNERILYLAPGVREALLDLPTTLTVKQRRR